MKIKARVVLSSHISDLQHETQMLAGVNDNDLEKTIKLRLGFIKFLNWKLKGDFNKEINPDKMYTIYLKIKEKEGI